MNKIAKKTRKELEKDNKKTIPELLAGNEWVFNNPILLQIVQEAPSATQADKRVKKMFDGLPFVNALARAICLVTKARIKSSEKCWKDLCESSDLHLPIEMFHFEKQSTPLAFSRGINFYPCTNNEGAICFNVNLPVLFREVKNIHGTCIISQNIPEVTSEKLHSLNVPYLELSSNPVEKFYTQFEKTLGALYYQLPNKEASNYQMPEIRIANYFLRQLPTGNTPYSTFWRKVVFIQDTGVLNEDYNNYEDSIVVLLNQGFVPRENSREAIGKVLFRRKHYLDKNNNVPISLHFEYVILPNLNLVRLARFYHEKPQPIIFGNARQDDSQPGYLAVDSKIFQEVSASLFEKLQRVNPYDPHKGLNLSSMFNHFLNDPQNLISLFC